MNKQPSQDDYHQMDNQKKRKRPNKSTGSGFTSENITSVRHLQGLLGDFSTQEVLNNGMQNFRTFLGRCSKSEGVSDEDISRNLKILKEWLEIQSKSASHGDVEESQGDAFSSILQVWGYASQSNSQSLLSATMATLAILVRICSHNEELKSTGAVLCKSVLQPTYLKIIYRSLVSNKEFISAPCLRLLTEINKFDFGSVCGLLHSAFDFTTKNITKHLEVIKNKGEPAVAIDDPYRPSLRTTFVRFILTFFQFGSTSVKNEMLGQRAWISQIFKYLRNDSPLVVNDVLEVMSIKVLKDKDISRDTKKKVFNDWVLSSIATLYSRTDMINITRAGRDEGKKVAEAVHEFLVSVCTTPGNGVCYSDSGWYPPGWTEADEKRRGGQKIHNRLLSLFISSIRPYADTLQQDLLLKIFKALPELVADYHLNNTFDFDPKLTSTWVGYYTFLTSTIQLPIPKHFGLGEFSVIPPPMNILIENVIPKSLGKATLTRCLAHSNSLIRFFVTRLLIFSFQKLRKVLLAIDDASGSMVDPSSSWVKTRFDFVEEFCKRVPDMGAVMGLINSTPKETQGKLQKEAASRLLVEYFASVPEVALVGKFDITIALGNLVDEVSSSEDRGLRLIEMSHLLGIAKEMPDVKWWNKSASIAFSPFVSILKVYCEPTSGLPLQQIRTLLHSFIAPSRLFQTETSTPPLEALLESLSSVQDKIAIDAIFLFLDESVARCIRTPFKYIDDYTELTLEVLKTNQFSRNFPAVSPLTMTLVEQWNFFIQSKYTSTVKHIGSIWLARFLESSAMLGENKYVLGALCSRLVVSCNESGDEAGRAVFKSLRRKLEGSKPLKLTIHSEYSVDTEDDTSAQPKFPRGLFNELRQLDVKSIDIVTKSIREREIEVSLFDIAVSQNAIFGVLKSQKISCEASCLTLSKLFELLGVILMRLKEGGDSTTWTEAKKMLARNSELVGVFLGVPEKDHDFPRYSYFSKRYSYILTTSFDHYQPVLSDVCERLKDSIIPMGHYLDRLINSDRLEILETYKNIIDRLFSPSDVLDCVQLRILIAGKINEFQFDVLALLLDWLSSRGEYLPISDLGKLFATNNMPRIFYEALTKYISSTPDNILDSFDLDTYDFNFKVVLDGWVVSLDSALMRKIKSVRGLALASLHKRWSKGKTIPHLAQYLVALVENFSVPADETGRFEWEKSMMVCEKEKMNDLFKVAQIDMFTGPMSTAQLELLFRATSLFTSLDRVGILKRVAEDNRASTLTAKTISLLEILMKNMETPESELPELRHWLLMVFDYLTRRFSEDGTLSEKIVNFTKQLGGLLSMRKINLPSSVPRTTLNAVLEAGLLKHISVPEVVYFAAVVVSQLPAKSLDIAKLLQMVLGHPQNTLLLRDNFFDPQEIYHHTAYLIYKLFSLARSPQSNFTTLDGVLSIYRGTNSSIDIVLLDIIHSIEGHLGRSLGTRITSWSVVDNSGGAPLISRTRGRLSLVIDSKTLARSIFQSSPARPTASKIELEDFNSFMTSAESEDRYFSKTYDLEFILPALTYILFLEGKVVDVQAIIEKHCVSFAITGLCSNRAGVRKMATSYLYSIVANLEESIYREKTQILQLLCSFLASMATREPEDVQKGLEQPLPTVIGVFLAQAVQVVSNPSHFLYEKIMEFLLHRPLLDLADLPLILQFSISTFGDEYQKEIGWILNILAMGLRTEKDLDICRKRNIFGNCLSLYLSPYSTDKIKEKIVELLWNAAAVEGGSTTLITRNGIISFIEGQLCYPNLPLKEKNLLKRLAARLVKSSARQHVKEWSKGNLRPHLTEGIFSM